jgi:hypothetical protein
VTIAVLASPALAATISVNSTSETVDGEDGLCTLTEAVLAANQDAPSGTATGECESGDGADVIVLQADERYSLSQPYGDEIDQTGLPVITSEIAILGNCVFRPIVNTDSNRT